MNPSNSKPCDRRSFLQLILYSGAYAAMGPSVVGCAQVANQADPIESRFLRSLSGLTPQYPSYEIDEELARSIRQWCGKVLLAGNEWDLNPSKDAVFQFPSLELNTYTFAVLLDDPNSLRNVIRSINDEELEDTIGIRLSDLDIVGGVLNLTRKIYYSPGVDKKKQYDEYNRERCTFSDSYWLDVYVKKEIEAETFIGPIMTIKSDFATPYYYRDLSDSESQEIASSITEYFQEPDDVILDWHELANAVSIENSRCYVQACLAGAGYPRKVFASYEDPRSTPYLMAYDDPTDNDYPTVYRAGPNAFPMNPIYVPNGPSAYSSEVLGGEGFQFSPLDKKPIAKLSRLDFEYVHINEAPVPIAPTVMESDLPDPPGEFWRLSHRLTTIDSVPRPDLPENAFGEAIVKLLLQESLGNAAYLGKGRFRVKADGLEKLAAGTGNWGSPETGVAILIVVAKGAAITLGIGSALIGIGMIGVKWAYGDEIEEELNDCYQQSGQACEACVRNSLGWEVTTWEGFGGGVAFAAGAIGIALGCALTFGLGCIAAIIGTIAGAAAMADSVHSQSQYIDGCPR